MPRKEPDHFADLPFPDKGLDVSGPINAQPPETTRVGQNVRSFEAISGRQRGGSRPGLGRYINARVNGISLIQDLNLIVHTAEGALGEGGGFQPFQASGISFLIDFVRTASGFTLTTRIEQLAFARSATITNAGSILGALTHPPTFPADYAAAADGFKIRVTAVDQLGAAVGLTVSDVDAALHTSGGVTYLGTVPTTYAWTRAYAANPGTTTYTVTVELLDAASASIVARSAEGIPTGGNLTGSFISSTTAGQLTTKTYTFRTFSAVGSNKTVTSFSPAPVSPGHNSTSSGFADSHYIVRDAAGLQLSDTLLSHTETPSSASVVSFNQALLATHTDGYRIGEQARTQRYDESGALVNVIVSSSVSWIFTEQPASAGLQDAHGISEYYAGYVSAVVLDPNAIAVALQTEAGG